MTEFIFLSIFLQETEAKRGLSIWVWVFIILVILVLLWLLLRSARRTAPKEESKVGYVPPPPAPMESVAQPVPAAPPAPDDLVIIEGIGPKIAQILNSNGITTFEQLAATDVSRLRAILDEAKLPIADPTSWPEQARLAAAGDQAGLQALQDRLKGGR